MSIDDHCEPAPGQRLISHEEVEEMFEKDIGSYRMSKYDLFMKNIKGKHPVVYKFLETLKTPKSY